MQKDAEALLMASEVRLRAVVDTGTDRIVMADRHGDIVELNRAAMQMFGYATSELLGRPLTTLMPERFHVAHRAAANWAFNSFGRCCEEVSYWHPFGRTE